MLEGLGRKTFLAAAAIAAFAGFAIFQGCSDAPQPGGTTKIVVNAAATGLTAPLDAMPDPKNENIYFLATGTKGIAVFKVASKGGDATEIFSGDPLVDPHGLVVGPDGDKLYIADRASEGGKGAIYVLATGGGAPALVTGTDGTHPSALDIVEVQGTATLYFAGDSGGEPAVFSISPEGGTPKVLLSGDPLGKPGGLAAAMDGTVYVTDEAPPSGGGTGAVFEIKGGKATSLATGFIPGSPAGTALTLDESQLLVSSLDESQGTSQVLIIDLKTAKTTTFNDVIKENKFSGGLHRAIASNDFGWAGVNKVYSVRIVRVEFEGSTPGGPSN